MVVGLVSLIAIWKVGQTAQRANLENAANGISAMIQRAQNEMKSRGHATFIELSQASATPQAWRVRMWEDTNDNGVLDAAPTDTLLDTFLPGTSISFSTTSTSQMATVNWSVNSTDTASRYLMCDFLGRTFIPGPPRVQNTAAATLDVTHVNMMPITSGKLTPALKYEIRVNPVWSSGIQRYTWSNTSSSWSKA